MQSFDYRGAISHGWRLVAVLGVVGLVVGLLLPTSGSSTQWSTVSNVGAPPATVTTTGGPISPGISTDQILFFGGNDGVYTEAGKLANMNLPLSSLRAMITLQGPGTTSSGSSFGQLGVVQVKVEAPTADESAALNNAYDDALALGLAAEAKVQLDDQVALVKSSISSVESQLQGQPPTAASTVALASQLTALQSRLAQLEITSPATGFEILQSASAGQATAVKPSLTGSRWARGLIGLVAGLILGVIVAAVVYLLDRRLLTARRAEAAFGYPVVLESDGAPTAPDEPYRRLWLSIFREPFPEPPGGSDPWAVAHGPVVDPAVLVHPGPTSGGVS